MSQKSTCLSRLIACLEVVELSSLFCGDGAAAKERRRNLLCSITQNGLPGALTLPD